MAAPNPTCPSFKKWRGVSKRENQRVQEDTKPPVFAPKFNVYVPPDLQDLLKIRPRNFSPDDLKEAVSAIKGSDSQQWLPATIAIRASLTRDKPPIQEVVDLGALPQLVYFMTLDDMPTLQLEAAWAMCNVASGNSAQCTAVVDAGALPPAFRLLSSSQSDLREQAAWLLGNITGDGAALRNKCLGAGILPLLLDAASKEGEMKPLRQLTWLMLNVTRFKPRRRETLLEVLPVVARVAESTDDSETLADAMSAVAHIADDCIEEVLRDARPVVERAGRLVNERSDPHHRPAMPFPYGPCSTTARGVALPAAKVLSALCAGDDTATQLVVDTGVLTGGYKRLLETVTDAGGLLREVCFAISNIAAGTQDQAIAVKEAGLLPGLVGMYSRYSNNDGVCREATWAICNMATKGLPALANAVREAGASGPLAKYLASHAAKAQRKDVTVTEEVAATLLAIACADAQAGRGGGGGGESISGDGSDDENGASTATAASNPAVAEFVEKGIYTTLQDTLDQGLLTGKALDHVKRLMAEFPPPREL